MKDTINLIAGWLLAFFIVGGLFWLAGNGHKEEAGGGLFATVVLVVLWGGYKISKDFL